MGTTTAATPLGLFLKGAADQRATQPKVKRDRDWDDRGLTAWLTALVARWLG